MRLTPALTILEAVRLAADAEIADLRRLVAHNLNILGIELVLRILLTYLPESIEPPLYTGFLQDLISGGLSPLDEDPTSSATSDLSDIQARHRVRKLHLLPLSVQPSSDGGINDIFTVFLLDRARRIDLETGSLPLLQQLIEPFLGHSDHLRTWAVSRLLPLLRLDYEYHPHDAPTYSLNAFEALHGTAAVNALLSEAVRQQDDQHDMDIGRDLRGLVGPWMYGHIRKRRKLDNHGGSMAVYSARPVVQVSDVEESSTATGWTYVNEWLLDLSLRNFAQAVKAIEQWEGPGDVDYGGWDDGVRNVNATEDIDDVLSYAQAGIAVIYSSSHTSSEILEGSHEILGRIAGLVKNDIDQHLQDIQTEYSLRLLPCAYLQSLSAAHLLHNDLLRDANPITKPTNESFCLVSLSLKSARTFQTLGFQHSTKNNLMSALFSGVAEQRDLLRRTLHTVRDGHDNSTDDGAWSRFRERLLWLQNWGMDVANYEGSEVQHLGVFGRLAEVELETEFLRALLHEGRNKLALEIYCDQGSKPISEDQVEQVVLEVAFNFFDNASNGNRSRGGVKKASETIAAFQSHFPKSKTFYELAALIRASHALSFYSLILERGVPFQPVNIRISPDALSLIDKVLKQNLRSYTKLDDLLNIGRDLVKAGLVKSELIYGVSPLDGQEKQLLLVERRIVAKAIEASLAEGDFETAYSYVINRLSPSELMPDSLPAVSKTMTTTEEDITWQAAYQAGRSGAKGHSGPSELRRLEQRMELLSQALLLAPPSSLGEVLVTWQSCEQEMNPLLARDSDTEDDKWDSNRERTLPGGFGLEDIPSAPQKPRESTKNAMNEEAPMGLFDVARGAASAFSRTAFPLRSPRIAESGMKGPLKASRQQFSSPGSSDDSTPHDIEGRVRKRDMVSNMVTGGFASGIGWVLG